MVQHGEVRAARQRLVEQSAPPPPALPRCLPHPLAPPARTCQKSAPRSGPPTAREASTASFTRLNQGSRTLVMLPSPATLPNSSSTSGLPSSAATRTWASIHCCPKETSSGVRRHCGGEGGEEEVGKGRGGGGQGPGVEPCRGGRAKREQVPQHCAAARGPAAQSAAAGPPHVVGPEVDDAVVNALVRVVGAAGGQGHEAVRWGMACSMAQQKGCLSRAGSIAAQPPPAPSLPEGLAAAHRPQVAVVGVGPRHGVALVKEALQKRGRGGRNRVQMGGRQGVCEKPLRGRLPWAARGLCSPPPRSRARSTHSQPAGAPECL